MKHHKIHIRKSKARKLFRCGCSFCYQSKLYKNIKRILNAEDTKDAI